MAEPIAQMAPPTAVSHKVNNSSTAAEFQTEPPTQPETSFRHISDTTQLSDLLPLAEKDIASEYWTKYERVAKQHDDEFIERQNGSLDSLLIFAGLFSSVSSAFIVNMQSSLTPQPSDTTNALLKVLINKIDNSTFSKQEASLPVWTGPSSMVIWIQALAYTSLSMSLLTAFGGVLGKQWLGHFKTSRFGQGTLRERCMRRQQKLDGLKTWHFNAIIATLPILLQLSLSFFGVALAANIWILQHTVAGIIIGTTSFGVIFYFFTVVASLKSPDCPFQTPVSTILNRVVHIFRETITVWVYQVRRQVRSKSWASFLSDLQEIMRRVFKSSRQLIIRSISRFRILLAMWPTIRSPVSDSESAQGSDKFISFEEIDLEPVGARSIQWILETSTDTDIITTAVMMIPEVEWPDEHDVASVLDRLTVQILADFDYPWALSRHTRERVRTSLKAIFHLYMERDLWGPLGIWHHDLYYQRLHLGPMPDKQDFQLISSVMERPYDLNIILLPFSDRMWMAHILTYRLYDGNRNQNVLAFVHNFIDKCLHDPKSPPRLVADCLVLAGLMVGLRPHRQYLAMIDKSAAPRAIQSSVVNHILGLLLDEAPSSLRGYALEARKLLQPLAYSIHSAGTNNYRISVKCLKLCFHFLKDPSTEGDQSSDVAPALRLCILYSLMVEEEKLWTFLYRTGSDESRSYWGGRPTWHTQAQFDLLVDFLVHVGQGTDYTTICDAFTVLAGLRGSPNTVERKRLYIETMIRIMESEAPLHTRHAALVAAFSLRTEIASMDRDDEPLRYLFSRALASVVRAQGPAMQQHTDTPVDNNPFNDMSSVNWHRNRCYLGLLCALSKEATWHSHLDCHGHFKNCLAVAGTLSSPGMLGGDKQLAVYLTYISAIIDALDKDHQFPRAIETYPIWRLILKAWLDTFMEPFFDSITMESWEELSSWGIVESLQPVAAYANKYWEQWNNRAEIHRLIQLVQQVSDKLEEEKRGGEQSVAPVEREQENDFFGHRGIPHLTKEIRELLHMLWDNRQS